MTTKLNQKIEKEISDFSERVDQGENPDAVLKNILRRVLKEQDRDTRHACAEAVLKSNSPKDAHDICMNVNALQ